MITRAQLEADGCVVNPCMWIGDGWFYCRTCDRSTRHVALSHRGESDAYEVCTTCDTYTGRGRLRDHAVTEQRRAS
ncbi:MAG: hypothetical protein RLZZ373_848 [Pseudomonadota bacterium]